MDSDLDARLSRISTQWTMVFQAHGAGNAGGAGAGAARAAQQKLLERYRGAVFRYLCGALRDPEAAEELAQEFALRFVRGDFRRADPERGRFRNYLKTALVHLVTDYHRARQAQPALLHSETPEPAAREAETPDQVDFASTWREEVLAQTWKALADFNPTYHAVLRLRVEAPDLTSAQMAEELAGRLGKPISPALVRKALQRAHEKFADLLLDEVARALDDADRDRLEEELSELDLLRYCRSALDRRQF